MPGSPNSHILQFVRSVNYRLVNISIAVPLQAIWIGDKIFGQCSHQSWHLRMIFYSFLNYYIHTPFLVFEIYKIVKLLICPFMLLYSSHLKFLNWLINFPISLEIYQNLSTKSKSLENSIIYNIKSMRPFDMRDKNNNSKIK